MIFGINCVISFFLFIIGISTLDYGGGNTSIFLIVISIISLPITFHLDKIREKNKKQKEIEDLEKFREDSNALIEKQYEKEYNQYLKEYNDECSVVMQKKNDIRSYDVWSNSSNEEEFYWIEDNQIKHFKGVKPEKYWVNERERKVIPPEKGEIKLNTFLKNIDDILYWQVEGNIQYTSDV